MNQNVNKYVEFFTSGLNVLTCKKKQLVEVCFWEKAVETATEIKIDNFVTSIEWLKFFRRYNKSFKQFG